jgi:cell division transport system ATP-binding protein
MDGRKLMNQVSTQLSKNFNTQKNLPLYYLKNVGVSFNQIKALDSVDIEINKAEIVFITGASGAGKTTLLNILAGEILPTKGQILSTPIDSKEHFIAQVFQDLRLIDHLSVYENLMLSYDKTIYASKKEFERDLQDLAKVLEVTSFLRIKVSHANGGLKQKIAMIRALLSKPTVLIADEPTCSMDANIARKIFEVVNFYNTKRKMTVVWATHDRDLISQFPGRIIHLDKGKMVYSGHACFI